MKRIHRSEERGVTRLDWLDSRHTFSFGSWYDPERMGFSSLRVLNDDRVAPGGGFPAHGHRDMEIVTWVLDGALEHRDSLGNGSVLRAGDLQRLTAGTGIRHSEWNHSATGNLRFLQIWIVPSEAGLEPGYQELRLGAPGEGGFRLVASPDGAEGSLTIHRDARIAIARLEDGQSVENRVGPDRAAWLQVARGRVTSEGADLKEGDALAVFGETVLSVVATEAADLILFDVEQR